MHKRVALLAEACVIGLAVDLELGAQEAFPRCLHGLVPEFLEPFLEVVYVPGQLDELRRVLPT